MEKEKWKDVVGYEGLYKVSNMGRVKNVKTGKLLSSCTDKDGYRISLLYNVNGRKTVKWHRLVATAFLPRVDGADQVNHKDGDKKNNCVDNLEWCSASENVIHRLYVLGEEMKIKRRSVRCVETGETYSSVHQAARAMGGSYGALSQAINPNIPTRHTFKGFHWEYI